MTQVYFRSIPDMSAKAMITKITGIIDHQEQINKTLQKLKFSKLVL